MAVDYWKLLRAFERAVGEVPEARAARFQAQARFAASRLATHLDAGGLHLGTYEGQAITPAIPVVALNADDLADEVRVVVESTVEPAVIAGNRVLALGRVIASAGDA